MSRTTTTRSPSTTEEERAPLRVDVDTAVATAETGRPLLQRLPNYSLSHFHLATQMTMANHYLLLGEYGDCVASVRV